MLNETIVGGLGKKGYVRIARFGTQQQDQIEEYSEALRMSPRYVDHVIVYDEQGNTATIFAKKLHHGVDSLPYKAAIMERLDKQTDKGLNKYGKLLNDNRMNTMARMEYLAEELTDGLQYIEHAKQGLTEVFQSVAGFIGQVMMIANRCDEATRTELTIIAKDANKLLGVVMGYEDDEQGRPEDTK